MADHPSTAFCKRCTVRIYQCQLLLQLTPLPTRVPSAFELAVLVRACSVCEALQTCYSFPHAVRALLWHGIGIAACVFWGPVFAPLSPVGHAPAILHNMFNRVLLTRLSQDMLLTLLSRSWTTLD